MRQESSRCTFSRSLRLHRGDITAGLYALGFHETERIRILVDLGTNGEMAVGNRDRILAASAAAGPAFEGGNITCGTGSIPGAICGVRWNGRQMELRTIGGESPAGICGTGIIETAYEMRRAGVLDETGRLEEPWDEKGFRWTRRAGSGSFRRTSGSFSWPRRRCGPALRPCS